MKITTFDPIIVSPKAADVVKLFEEMGFEKTHSPVTVTETIDIPSTRMKDSNGFHVDVAEVTHITQDMTYIRMNVDEFDEAYNILTSFGFRNTRGDRALETGHSKSATMVSDSGLIIALVKHIKKDSEQAQ
jgi:hypothetical protein